MMTFYETSVAMRLMTLADYVKGQRGYFEATDASPRIKCLR